jgi:hypothetical protein
LLFKNFAKIGLAASVSSILVLGLLAGCGGTTTVTTTVGGGGSTQTVTTTVGGGGGAAMANLVVYGDMVSNIGCLNTSFGHRGELLVFRGRVVDPKTGVDMTDQELTSVTAVLPDGQTFKMNYGGHGGNPPSDTFWAGIWEVPLNYPTGTLGYELKAVAKDGRSGTFSPFELTSSKLTIVEFDVDFVRPWTVNITAAGFSVPTLTITQGAKVTFSNKDTIPHAVKGQGWESGNIAAAGTFARVFNEAGTFVVTDAANPAISVTIVVNAAS